MDGMTSPDKMARLSTRQRFLHPMTQKILAETTKEAKRLLAISNNRKILFDDWTDVHLDKALWNLGISYPQDSAGVASRHVLFAQARSLDWGSPIWSLDKDVADAFMRTKAPFDVLTPEIMETALRLPFPGFYLQLPTGLYDLIDADTGEHPVEGVWVAGSWDLSPKQGDRLNERVSEWGKKRGLNLDSYLTDQQDADIRAFRHGLIEGMLEAGEYVPTITIAAQGQSKGLMPDGTINDTSVSARIQDSMTMDRIMAARKGSGLSQTISVVFNFLMALNADYLDTPEHPERRRPNAGKRRKAERRGEIYERYTRVSLSKRGQQARTESRVRPEPGTGEPLDHAIAVAGHWRSYWVTAENVGDRVAHDARTNTCGTELRRVVRWIFPYIRGVGEPIGPSYKVSK
jgi:hypothetical protein